MFVARARPPFLAPLRPKATAASFFFFCLGMAGLYVPAFVNEAMTVLFALTEFHDVSFNLFLKYAEGQLTFEEEQMLKALGVKI